MNSAARILIVDDEPQIRTFLRISLEAHGFAPREAASGTNALKAIAADKPDMMILDLGLPDRDGLTLIREIREHSRMPIIVLSVRSNEQDKVRAFDLGANDYVTKPFGINELMARIRACLRDLPPGKELTGFEGGDLKVDFLKHSVTVRGERIRLTPKEYKLLKILIAHAGRVVTHRQLIQQLWGQAYGDDTQYLRIYIRQLRQKIELDRARDHFIHTEPGIGYRFEAESR